MKELSIEEKAKAYDEKLDVARHIYADPSVKDEDKYYIEVIFPELSEESEDERIRKELLSVVNGLVLPDEQQSRFVAWLENQGEHAKFCDSIQVGDKVTRNQDGVLVNLSQLNRVAKTADKQGEQKPAWSEEDEKIFRALSNALARISSNTRTDSTSKNYSFFTEIDWLKSLKDRVQPQPKQEWSEEEKLRIDRIIDVLDWAEDRGRISYSDWEEYVIYVRSLRPQSNQSWYKLDNETQKEIVNYFEAIKEQEPTRIKTLNGWIDWLKSLRPQNRCGWNDMSVKPIYPCDILYQHPNGNIFIYRYLEGGRKNDAQTTMFCNLDENGKWIYLKDVEPQNRWKPSDEQMGALKHAFNDGSIAFADMKILATLYEQLKALHRYEQDT